ncbi:MAG TPA: methyltransferase domain-containing protein [Actinomycetota bacterium]|nr:methyltransferase domain-containing protein [Actinomycetota bacterium]
MTGASAGRESTSPSLFERQRVPELFDPWASHLLDAADLRSGERVLDVACGTGVVARRAAGRVLPDGIVIGLDGSEPALEVAQAAAPGVQWRRGEASSLPFADAAFDVVVCQQGLQVFPDRHRALLEMRRVLVLGGRVGVSVWGPIERSPAFAALADSLERRAGVHVAAAVRWLFSLPEPEDLRALLAVAGFGRIRVRSARRATRFPSVAEFLRRYVPGAPVGSATTQLSEGDWRQVVADVESDLAPWVDSDGLRIVTEANTGVARR